MTEERFKQSNPTSEASNRLAALLQEINVKIAVAEEFAKEHNLVFKIDFGYGGRASYGLHPLYCADDFSINYSQEDVELDEYDEEATRFWKTSTMSCM